MEPREQEIAIGELEERVDRLRVLYEQYFLGFEKLEPTVPRKDVDRRFAILRREQIRNTAVRFRFQVVTQKFNTYAMHWMRICRQIEDGTYKRHLRKAQQRFGEGSPDMVARRAKRDAVELEFSDVDLDEAALSFTDAEGQEAHGEAAKNSPSPPAPADLAEKAAAAKAPAGEPKLRAYRDLGAATPGGAQGTKVQRPQVVLRPKDGEGRGDPLLRTGERASVQAGAGAEPSKPDLLARTGERPHAPADTLARTGERPHAPADPLARTGARPVALPPGAKPRIVLKRPDGTRPEGPNPDPLGARPAETAAARPTPSSPGAAPRPAGTVPDPKPTPAAQTSGPRPPAPQAPGLPGASSAQPRPPSPGPTPAPSKPHSPDATPGQPKPLAPGATPGQPKPLSPGATPGQPKPLSPGATSQPKPLAPGATPGQPKPLTPGIGARPQGPKPPPPLPSKKD